MSDAHRVIRLALIGHTNTGKTSVLRSLLRDATLGTVADAPGTTRESARHTLRLGGAEVAELWDTPGLEDAARALAALGKVEREQGLSGAAALDALLADPPGEIEQDLKPLRTLQSCDAGLLVFDAREPPRNKYWEEHELLRRCGRPIVAVLNCAADERARTDEWDAALRKNGLHAVARYDAWAASEADASKLFTKLRELLDQGWEPLLRRIARQRSEEQDRRVRAMCEELAALLVDLATHRMVADRDRLGAAADELAGAIAGGWTRMRVALAELHGVSPDRLAKIETELDQQAAREANPLALADPALSVGSAATVVAGGLLAGAVKGGIVDVGTGGATLGLGMVVGGAAGLALGGRELARHALLRSQGKTELTLGDAALDGVLRRGLWLVERLQTYGQASERPLAAPAITPEAAKRSGSIAARLRTIRRHRDWSRLTGDGGPRPEGCIRAIGGLAEKLAGEVQTAGD